ncbi:hypothetical protein LCGC14_2801380 [marine sediment metagenome]|uniref:Uncharacterized protein n=1 Tax=marine sediment metagenome TaxID=412755 RepID=A0A0F8YMJ3_9ZZZZ
MANILEIAEGLQFQGSDERIAYTITTTNWVSSPTSPVVVAFEVGTNQDVTSTVFPSNSPSVSNDVISLSLLRELTQGAEYRIEVKFTVSSSIYECFFLVKCNR